MFNQKSGFINNPGDRPKDNYREFEALIAQRFAALVCRDTPLFIADIDKDVLWNTYLDSFKTPQARSHYNCNACREFIIKYGALVMIDETGRTVSPIWEPSKTPAFFFDAVTKLEKLVLKAPIKRLFIAEQRELGQAVTGEWTHLSARLPVGYNFLHNNRLLSAGQVMAEKKEQYGMLSRALNNYSIETIEKTLTLVKSDVLYRGDKCQARLEWFLEVATVIDELKGTQKKNMLWLAVAFAPVGFCNINSSIVGSLLDDIQAGIYSYEDIKSRFQAKMDPSKYMRSQKEISSNQVYEAEKIIAKLGLENSLARRYANLDEIIDEAIWTPQAAKTVEKKSANKGVFGHLTTKNTTSSSVLDTDNLPTVTMTWDKFLRTVLPKTSSIEALVDNPNHLMALTTAVDKDAENILQWNNPYSWYYHGGADAEMKKRVESAGGKYENNIIRCSLMWEGYTDLDLHCITPSGHHLYFGKKNCDGGYLDIDMNAGSHRDLHPIENIRWESNPPSGHYKFYVNNYNERVNRSGTPYKVELEINNVIYAIEKDALKDGISDTVFEFDYRNGKVTNLVVNGEQSSVTAASNWNINNSWVKVNAIFKSPNLWSSSANTVGDHTFFILDECKDMCEGFGKGFFVEMLRSDLKQIRKTLDAYTSQTPISGAETADACGLGYNKDREWNLTLKVNENGTNRLIKIDRFD